MSDNRFRADSRLKLGSINLRLIATCCTFKWKNTLMLAMAPFILLSYSAHAQNEAMAPSEAIDGDLSQQRTADPQAEPSKNGSLLVQDNVPDNGVPSSPEIAPATSEIPEKGTFQESDLIGPAERIFGKGAQGLGKLIEDILKKQGRPNGYIVGREGGGAFIVGLRYGSGTLNHRVEGEKPVYWTGPSIGPDAGANAGSTFILVYNLYDTEDIYKRFPAAEGVAYIGGGFNASYLRRGDVVLIPIRVGAGLRLGANVGYMRFSKKQRWSPF